MHAGQDAYRAVKMLDKEGLSEFSIMMIVMEEDWQHSGPTATTTRL